MKTENAIRIATVYNNADFSRFTPYLMCDIRWIRISEAIARAGFQVDIIMSSRRGIIQRNENLRFVSPHVVRWEEYDVIKTLFHKGFQFIAEKKADNHPFIISKLGSVVGKNENTEGVYFFNEIWKGLVEIQKKIARKSKFVTVLTDQSRNLWHRDFSRKNNTLLVPTGVDKTIPPPRKNPYAAFGEKIAVYIGNIYSPHNQGEINLIWQKRLNKLGRHLKKKGIRLCLIAGGDSARIDREAVTFLGRVEHKNIWDYQYFADVGVVLAQGQAQHNESSKIYYYLRAGLPVVSEEPVPNNNIIEEANLGFIVPFGDTGRMADRIEEACRRQWDKKAAVRYVLKHHTWDRRAETYIRIIRKELSSARNN